jgi:hypothetical protein
VAPRVEAGLLLAFLFNLQGTLNKSWCREGESNPPLSKGDFKIPSMLVNFNADAGFRGVIEYTQK